MNTLTKTLLVTALLALGTAAVAAPASADEYGYCIYSHYSIPPSTCDACVDTPNLPGEHRCGYIIVE